MRSRRLPPYLYVLDLIKGRRVLEIGCDDGDGAALLIRGGAASVVGVDRSAQAIQDALSRHNAPNLEFRIADYGSLALPDRNFDVVCVPEAADLLAWAGFLEEARRALADGGHALFVARSADRPDGRGGISYHDMVDRLQPLFGPVRMIGMSPFQGFSLVEFGQEDAVVSELEIDTSLHTSDPSLEIADYVALTGPVKGSARGFLLVQAPPPPLVVETREPIRASEGELQRRLLRVVDERDALEAQLAGMRRRVADAESEVGSITAKAAREIQLARAEARRAAERAPLAPVAAATEPEAVPETPPAIGPSLTALLVDRQILEWSVAELEGRAAARAPAPEVEALLAAAGRHAQEMQARAAELDELRAYVEELRSERDEAIHHAGRARQTAEALQAECERLAAELRAQRDRSARAEGELLRRSAPPPQPPVPAGDPAELEKANARWKQAEAKSDELWRKIGEMQRELEQNREQAVETARQQRQAAQVALTRAMEEASKKLVSAKDEATRGERERGELESTVTGLKAELAKARQTGEDARAELETIRVMSAQGYLEVRQEITRAREQAAEETHRAATEREAGQRREAAVATRLEELDEIVRILAAGLREEELRLGQLEDGIRTVHQHAHSIPDPEEMERELVKHAIDGRDHLQLLAVRERRIQRLTVELGERDAELAILHAAVSTARGQVLDLVEMIRKTRQDISGRASAVDIVAALDRLAAEASELTGRL